VVGRPPSQAAVSEARIGIAIVSYNTAPLLRRCLESVAVDTDAAVVVVDNGSTDGSVELVQREFPLTRVEIDSDNRGYGAAANRAVQSLRSRYVLLLNADTELSSGTVEALADYLDRHPRTAIAGPRLVNAAHGYEPSGHAFPTPFAVFMRESPLRHIPRRRRDEWRSESVEWLLGAALAIRRDAFIAVGGFDEGYFLYAEEVDLCYRLRAAGWEVHYAPVATILHVGGASTSQYGAEMLGHSVRSTRRFARLRLSRSNEVGVRLVYTGVFVARLGFDLIRLVWAREVEQRERLRHLIGKWICGLEAVRGSLHPDDVTR
jgi:N-acetylglucosaminyl-diphospho-decaprenol L-rhamnosyltransferase